MKPTTSQRERRRFASCCAKRSRRGALTSGGGPVHREVHHRHGALRRVLDLPELRRRRLREPRDEVGGELHLRGVVLRRRVVVELPRESDLVLRTRELLLQLRDVAGGLELRIVLRQREE